MSPDPAGQTRHGQRGNEHEHPASEFRVPAEVHGASVRAGPHRVRGRSHVAGGPHECARRSLPSVPRSASADPRDAAARARNARTRGAAPGVGWQRRLDQGRRPDEARAVCLQRRILQPSYESVVFRRVHGAGESRREVGVSVFEHPRCVSDHLNLVRDDAAAAPGSFVPGGHTGVSRGRRRRGRARGRHKRCEC